MTIQEFKNLKKGDIVYIRKTKRNKAFCTCVLDIDRFHKKVKVLLRDKFLSYKYINKKTISADFFVGICKNYCSNP